MDERRERRFEVRAGGRNVRRSERVPKKTLAVRDDEVTVVDSAERDERTRTFDGCAAVAQRDLCLAEEFDYCRGIEPTRASRGELAAQDDRRSGGLALSQVQGGDRRGGFLPSLDAAQQPASVLEASLREPEFGECP